MVSIEYLRIYPDNISHRLATEGALTRRTAASIDGEAVDGHDPDHLSLFPGLDAARNNVDFSLAAPMSSYRPAVDVFVERFVDAFSLEVGGSQQASALRAAASVRMFSPILTDAFEAVSVAFFGRTTQDRAFETAGLRLYPRVLQRLQIALNDTEQSKAESTLLTVILLIAFEVRCTRSTLICVRII